MVAQYSYEATQPEDLEFQAGDVILVLSKGNCAPATAGDGRESVGLALRCQTPGAAGTDRKLLLQTAEKVCIECKSFGAVRKGHRDSWHEHKLQVEAKGEDTQPAVPTFARWESFTSAAFKHADQCILASF